jgi:hypothetical protein
MANLAQKLNRFIVKDYFDELKELVTNEIRYHGQDWKDLHCWQKRMQVVSSFCDKDLSLNLN